MSEPTFQNIHIRRMYWAISSPSLLAHPYCCNYFKDEKHELDVLAKLAELDSQSELVNAHFDGLRHMPMGKYFEQLIFFMLKHDTRYVLMLSNHQIKEGNRTVGELDLIVKDTQTQKREHWEVAIKFYLQCDSSPEQQKMIGPDAIDNLARKMEKLTSHQLPLSKHSSIQYLVGANRTEPKLFMKGQCFYHLNNMAILPKDSDPGHEKGSWCHVSEIDQMISENLRWTTIQKPDWIGRYESADESKILSSSQMKQFLVEHFKQDVRSVLCVGLKPTDRCCIEVSRCFVVNNHWPNPAN